MSTAAGLFAGIMTLLTTVMAFATMTAEVTLDGGEPLVRTRSSTQLGTAKDVVVDVTYDYRQFDGDTLRGINCLLTMLGATGNNSTFPVPGPVSGATVTITPGRGFADRLKSANAYVMFNDIEQRKIANDNGRVPFPVVGRLQPEDLPDDAPAVDKTFTVILEATGDPVNGHTIARTFLDSVLCAGGIGVDDSGGAGVGSNILGCLDAFADIAKQFDWDLGEWEFGFVDWAKPERKYSLTATWSDDGPPSRGDNLTELTGTARITGEFSCPATLPANPSDWVCYGTATGRGAGAYTVYKSPHDPSTKCFDAWSADNLRWTFKVRVLASSATPPVDFEELTHTGGGAVCGTTVLPPLPFTNGGFFDFRLPSTLDTASATESCLGGTTTLEVTSLN